MRGGIAGVVVACATASGCAHTAPPGAARASSAVGSPRIACPAPPPRFAGKVVAAAAPRSSVAALAMRPDGAVFATADGSSDISLRDGTSGELRAILHGHATSVSALAFAARGDVLYSSAADGSVRRWDARTGASRELCTGMPTDLEVSADGKLVALSNFAPTAHHGDLSAVRIVDAESGAVRAAFDGAWHGFSGDGAAVAIGHVMGGGGDQMIEIVDLPTGKPRFPAVMSSGAFAWLPDGQRVVTMLSSFDDDTPRGLAVLDARTGATLVRTDRPPNEWISRVSVVAGGARTLVSIGDRMTLMDGEASKTIASMGPGTAVVSTDGSRVAMLDRDATRFYDATNGARLGAIGAATLVAFDRDGGRWVAAEAHALTIGGPASAAPRSVPYVALEDAQVAWRADGRYLATCHGDSAVRIWDATRGGVRATTSVPSCMSLAWSATGTLAIAGSDGVSLIRAGDPSRVRAITGAAHTRGPLAWSPDGSSLVVGSIKDEGRLLVYDAATDAVASRFSVPRARLAAASWSADGALLATQWSSNVLIVLDARTMAVKWKREGDHADIAFGPRGIALAASGHLGIDVFDALADGPIATLPPVDAGMLGWSADGRWMSVSAFRGSRVFSIPNDGVAFSDVPLGGTAWSPRGDVLAIPTGAGIALRRAHDGATVWLHAAHDDDGGVAIVESGAFGGDAAAFDGLGFRSGDLEGRSVGWRDVAPELQREHLVSDLLAGCAIEAPEDAR